MSAVVVVGDAELELSTRQLLPNYQVMGIGQDPELGDPITSVAVLRALIETANPPDAVVCGGAPGFTILSQLPHFPPSRCYVCPGSSAGWPAETMRWIAEATGMTLLPQLESLPAAILARGAPSSPRQQEVSSAGPTAQRQLQPAPTATGAASATPPASPRERDFSWADATPVQVPPPPVSLDTQPVSLAPQIIDAGPSPALRSAYLPRDLLRPLRPRSG
ncbi:MAG: hypothetical protein ACYCYK_07840 [Candidatus Dormibacteria bacterium]